MRLLITLLLLTLFSGPVSAHYLWVEGPAAVNVGADIQYHVHWGHLGEEASLRTTTPVEAYIKGPDGSIQQLSWQDHQNHLQTEVEMRPGGDHQIFIKRPPGIYQEVLNHFTAKIIVDVMAKEEMEAWSEPVGLDLEIIPQTKTHHLHSGQEFESLILFESQPLVNAQVSLLFMGDNSTASFRSDHQGIVSVPLLKEGQYLLMVSHQIPQQGEGYYMIGHIHTLFLETHSH